MKHCESKTHLKLAKSQHKQSKINFGALTAASELATKRTEVELRMAVLLASCNVPLSFNDQLSPAIRSYQIGIKISLCFYKSHLYD